MEGEERKEGYGRRKGYGGGGGKVKYTFGLFEMSLAIKRRMFWCVRLLLSFLCSAAIQEGISSGVVPCGDTQTEIYTHAHMHTCTHAHMHTHKMQTHAQILGSQYHGNRFSSILIEQSTRSLVT